MTIDTEFYKYEVFAYRKPIRGEFYFHDSAVLRAWGHDWEYTEPKYIAREREPLKAVGTIKLPPPRIEITAAPLLPQPVLVVDPHDGKSSSLTFYDADLAHSFLRDN